MVGGGIQSLLQQKVLCLLCTCTCTQYSRVCQVSIHGRTTPTNSEMAAWAENSRLAVSETQRSATSGWKRFTSDQGPGPGARLGDDLVRHPQDLAAVRPVRDSAPIRHGLPFRTGTRTTARNHRTRVPCAHALIHVRRRTKKCALEAPPATVSQRVLLGARLCWGRGRRDEN